MDPVDCALAEEVVFHLWTIETPPHHNGMLFPMWTHSSNTLISFEGSLKSPSFEPIVSETSPSDMKVALAEVGI